MLICLYGEIRDALWPERGLSGSVARYALVWLCYPLGAATTRAFQNVAHPWKYRGSEFIHARAQARAIQIVLPGSPSSSFKRSKPRLDQNRTARAFALLTPTCVASTPCSEARAIHSENSIVPAPRPWVLSNRFRCRCAG